MDVQELPVTSQRAEPNAICAVSPASLLEFRPAITLDGEWLFQFGDEAPAPICVPGPWESQRHDLHGRAGTAIYERSFTLPADFEGRHILLHFGAVDYFTEVWVNGTWIGSHEGGYTPFAFPIGAALQGFGPDNIHTIVVRVTDATLEQDAILPGGTPLAFAEIPHGKQSWYTSIGGIWQSVFVEARAATYLERAVFTPDIDSETATLYATIRSLTGIPEGQHRIRISIDVPPGAVPIEPFVLPVEVSPGELPQELHLKHTFTVPQATLWSPETPHLYRALVALECDGEIEDAIVQRFGMRKIAAREGRVWLNNRPYFLMGALDQAFYPQTIYTPPTEEFLRDQFQKAKEMGLNLMRCHIKVPTESYLYLCDEIGLLVWYEIPNGAKLSQAFRQRARATFESMWHRDASHPSIVIASIINESWGIDLNDGEQRRWLASTYRWAKELASTWLIVDNSACIPNFHVISDLDDYHVYFNIPDQAEDFTEWIQAFTGREAGTYTGYGDAERARTEPLLISEFGNWGLPHVDSILKAEACEPYWFKTGDGATRPGRVLQRFEQQKLERVFADYNALADASQEQEWLSLKWEIEEMRRFPEVAGYVITEFTDVNWECNGLLDMARKPKVFHHRLKALQQQDIIIPRFAPRTAFWEGETAALSLYFSNFSGRSVQGGTIVWSVEGLDELGGEEPVRLGGRLDTEPPIGSYPIGQIWITAPAVPQPSKFTIQIVLKEASGFEVARTSQTVVFAPVARRTGGRGKTLWLYDPLGSAIGLSSLLVGMGFRVVAQPEPGAIGLLTRWDPTVAAFLHSGGKAVLVATQAKSITIFSGLGVRLLERSANGWWGDWCTTKTWFVPEYFPSIPDTLRMDFEFQQIIPERVLTGPLVDNVVAGLFIGWLHNPAALVARLPIGNGSLTVTTFDLLPHIGSDPIATLLLQDLLAMPPAVRLD